MLRRPRVRLPRPRRGRLQGRFRGRLSRVSGTWLPGLLTIFNLLGGYGAILAAAERQFLLAAALILAAAVFDFIDGRVARLTGSTSDMGQQLDSLADAVSFAVAPSMLAFHMGLRTLGRVGYAVCFVFAACGVIRLARFNVLPPDHRHFIGLPIPMAAAATLIPVLVTRGQPLPLQLLWLHAAAVTLLALLMVSRIHYRSFKDLRFSRRQYRVLAGCVVLLALLAVLFEWILPLVLVLYIVSPALFWSFGAIASRAGGREQGAPSPRVPWRADRGRDLEEDDVLD